VETLSFVFSALCLISIILSLLLKGRDMKRILMLNLLGNALMVASYACVYNWNGALSCTVGAVAGVINFCFTVKRKSLPVCLLFVYAAVFVAVNLTTFVSWVDLLSTAACLMFVMLICSPEGRRYRIWSLGNNTTWTVFDLLKGSYGPLVTHVILTGVTVAGMLIHDRRKAVKDV